MWNIIKAVGSAALHPVRQAASGTCNTMFSALCHTLCRTQVPTTFLAPQSVTTIQIAGFRVKGIVKTRCKSCRRYMQGGRMYIYCMDFPKHNQMSMVKKHYNRWHLTHATQGKLRPY